MKDSDLAEFWRRTGLDERHYYRRAWADVMPPAAVSDRAPSPSVESSAKTDAPPIRAVPMAETPSRPEAVPVRGSFAFKREILADAEDVSPTAEDTPLETLLERIALNRSR
ncbi:hypothetical protein [Halotalea alkalilenta]|uniref:hypothetical protein n=1 Tax=Halotalea alkalilenta TaxID=376489 RepID=UPI0012DE7CBA|nr:hypothetical protein [Halotalea alkalilenta]